MKAQRRHQGDGPVSPGGGNQEGVDLHQDKQTGCLDLLGGFVGSSAAV